MDRKIEKKAITGKRLVTIIIMCLAAGFLIYLFTSRSGSRLNLDANRTSRITIAEVEYGEFQEYYPFDGRVVPDQTVYIALEQGGRVEEILVEGGEPIRKGDVILRLSNPSVVSSNLTREAQIREQIHLLSNSQINSEQTLSTYKENILNRERDLKIQERKYERYKTLRAEEIAITDEEFENLRDNLETMRETLKLYKERVRRETVLIERKLKMDENSIQRYNYALELLEESMKSLEVTARITGHLSEINAEIGQNLNTGHIIGQIDILDKLKIQAGIDQYYNSKVRVGTRGNFSLDGSKYDVEVKKIFPEIISDQFRVDLDFIGEPPEGIKRGHTLTVELNFSEAEESLRLKKGSFYQQTSGRWAYVISKDGKTAHKVDMRLGRQNPRYVEVLEGLNEGDLVITSGYDTFKDYDELIFHEPVNLE